MGPVAPHLLFEQRLRKHTGAQASGPWASAGPTLQGELKEHGGMNRGGDVEVTSGSVMAPSPSHSRENSALLPLLLLHEERGWTWSRSCGVPACGQHLCVPGPGQGHCRAQLSDTQRAGGWLRDGERASLAEQA